MSRGGVNGHLDSCRFESFRNLILICLFVFFLFSRQLHMLRVSPSMGQVLEMNTTLRHLLFLLEYCMVTGYDWWDVLLHVQPSMVHNLVEKLHEEYMRQNQALQQVSKACWEKTTRPGL